VLSTTGESAIISALFTCWCVACLGVAPRANAVSTYHKLIHVTWYKKKLIISTIFFSFTTTLIWFGSQFWHQVVSAPSRSQLWGSNCGPHFISTILKQTNTKSRVSVETLKEYYEICLR
jgi:hypothetical protein